MYIFHIWLHRLGQTNLLTWLIKDGVVLPDEDISQDPQWHVTAEASHATAGALWTDKKKRVNFTKSVFYWLNPFCFHIVTDWPKRRRQMQRWWSLVRWEWKWSQACCWSFRSSLCPVKNTSCTVGYRIATKVVFIDILQVHSYSKLPSPA